MRPGKVIVEVIVKVSSDDPELKKLALEAIKRGFFDSLDGRLEEKGLTIEPPISDGFRESDKGFLLIAHVLDDREFYSSLRQLGEQDDSCDLEEAIYCS